MALDSELPDELQTQAPKKRLPMDPGAQANKLASLGTVIAQKRDDAVQARKASGIEEVWTDCEEAYLGIDDANRGDFQHSKWVKPTSMSGPVREAAGATNKNKSTIYIRLTTRYVDMGAAKLSEIVLPIDDKAFGFGPSPEPDLVGAGPDGEPIQVNGQPVFPRHEMAQTPVAAAVPGQPPQAQAAPVDPEQQREEVALQAAKKAENRIYDWMVECRYPMHMRKVVHDSARIGVGVLKGPFPDMKESRAFSTEGGKSVFEMVSKVVPSAKWIDPWNFFPHGSCGEDVHKGDHVFERDFLAPASLTKLKDVKGCKTDKYPQGEPIYLAAQIDKVLAEGPGKAYQEEEAGKPKSKAEDRFEVWHFTGTLTPEDMLAMGAPGADELPESCVRCFAVVTIVNDTVIRATFNPLEKTGHFPYRVFQWSRRAGHWAGVGIAEQVNAPQRMVNGGTRAWMNNAGKAAGSQFFMDSKAIAPSDGSWDITPDKVWWFTGDGVVDDIRKVLYSVDLPDRGDTLIKIIDFAFKQAEELSNISLVSQGQSGANDPQTFGQAELLNTNAQTLFRDKAYTLDDVVTEPVVNDFYEWLLLDPDVPNDEKGDFKINARGSIAMVEKAIQEQTYPVMLQMALNPVWGQDPKKLFAEWMKTKRLNPEMTKYSDAELERLQSTPPPDSPAVAAAKVRGTVAVHVKDMDDQTRLQIEARRHDRETIYQDSLNERAQIDAKYRDDQLHMQWQIALLAYAKDMKISIQEAKVQLAQVTMKGNLQRELSTDALAVQLHTHHVPGAAEILRQPAAASGQVMTPEVEPAGRAPDGESFAQ